MDTLAISFITIGIIMLVLAYIAVGILTVGILNAILKAEMPDSKVDGPLSTALVIGAVWPLLWIAAIIIGVIAYIQTKKGN